MDIEHRLISLETKLSYQDNMIADLDEVVTAQDQIIRQLEKKTKLLEHLLKGLAENEQNMTIEKPPHY